MMTNESLRRIVSESPVHGPILLDEVQESLIREKALEIMKPVALFDRLPFE